MNKWKEKEKGRGRESERERVRGGDKKNQNKTHIVNSMNSNFIMKASIKQMMILKGVILRLLRKTEVSVESLRIKDNFKMNSVQIIDLTSNSNDLRYVK